MRAVPKRLVLFTALALAGCGGDSNTNDLDAATLADMSAASEDAASIDGAIPHDGGILDANISRDSGGDAMSSGCTNDTMCADPIRERCNTTTRACEGRPQWAITTIRYEDGEERVLDDIVFHGTTLFENGDARISFQQGRGRTIWAFELPAGTATGTHPIEPLTSSRITLGVNETSSDVPEAYRDGWQADMGTIVLSACSLRPDGIVQGTLEARIRRDGSGSDVMGLIQSEFMAEFSR